MLRREYSWTLYLYVIISICDGADNDYLLDWHGEKGEKGGQGGKEKFFSQDLKADLIIKNSFPHRRIIRPISAHSFSPFQFSPIHPPLHPQLPSTHSLNQPLIPYSTRENSQSHIYVLYTTCSILPAGHCLLDLGYKAFYLKRN